MFLLEAIAARRGDYSNSGLADNAIRANRLTALDQRIGAIFQGGYWTDQDPTSALNAFHSFGSTSPSWNDVWSYVSGLLHPIARNGGVNAFVALDSATIENLFNDVGLLNYTVLFDSSGGTYNGFLREIATDIRTVSVRGRNGSLETTTTDSRNTSYLWVDRDSETYNHQSSSYGPNGLRSSEVVTTTNVACTFSEQSGISSYRNYHRYMEVKPYCVASVTNDYYATWEFDGDVYTHSDIHTNYGHVWCPLPITTYTDMLTAQTIVLNNQSAWGDWVTDVFDAANLEQYAADVAGQYTQTNKSHSRQRASLIGTPSHVVWVAHFLYCNLEGVV